MNNGYVMDYGIIEILASKPDAKYLVVGTGLLAHEMQKKIKLLGLHAPFLVGDKDDPENDVRCYKKLSELENPLDYVFIFCIDVDEFKMFAPVCSFIYEILGASSFNHPNVIRFSMYRTIEAYAGKYLIDSHVYAGHERGGTMNTVFGDDSDKAAFRIHLLGDCTISSIYNHAIRTVPEILWEKLTSLGINAVVYSWGQPLQPTSDSLVLLIRNVMFKKPDHVILSVGMQDSNPVNALRKNILSVREVYQPRTTIRKIMSSYPGERSNGIDHDIDYASIYATQGRIMNSLAKCTGFEFWHVILPSAKTMAERQSRRLLGLSVGHLSRERNRKDTIISRMDPSYTRDYSGIFDNVSNIAGIFTEKVHFTETGNEILAENLANDISNTFSDLNKRKG